MELLQRFYLSLFPWRQLISFERLALLPFENLLEVVRYPGYLLVKKSGCGFWLWSLSCLCSPIHNYRIETSVCSASVRFFPITSASNAVICATVDLFAKENDVGLNPSFAITPLVNRFIQCSQSMESSSHLLGQNDVIPNEFFLPRCRCLLSAPCEIRDAPVV